MSNWGMLMGVGQGLQGFGEIMGEYRRNSWEDQKDELRWKRAEALETLRAKNNSLEAEKNRDFTIDRDESNRGFQTSERKATEDFEIGKQIVAYSKDGIPVTKIEYGKIPESERGNYLNPQQYQIQLSKEAFEATKGWEKSEREAKAAQILKELGVSSPKELDPALKIYYYSAKLGIDFSGALGGSRPIAGEVIGKVLDNIHVDKELSEEYNKLETGEEKMAFVYSLARTASGGGNRDIFSTAKPGSTVGAPEGLRELTTYSQIKAAIEKVRSISPEAKNEPSGAQIEVLNELEAGSRQKVIKGIWGKEKGSSLGEVPDNVLGSGGMGAGGTGAPDFKGMLDNNFGLGSEPQPEWWKEPDSPTPKTPHIGADRYKGKRKLRADTPDGILTPAGRISEEELQEINRSSPNKRDSGSTMTPKGKIKDDKLKDLILFYESEVGVSATEDQSAWAKFMKWIKDNPAIDKSGNINGPSMSQLKRNM